MTVASTPPPEEAVPARLVGDGRRSKADRFLKVTTDEHHQVVLVTEHAMWALSDDAVDQLRAALKEQCGYAQRRRAQ